MQRAVITAKGDVQRVGYRDTVQKIARDLEITGCIQNIELYDVRMIAEGYEKRLKQFIEAIKIERYPIFVKELDVEWGDATDEFEYFEVIRGDWKEELFERFDVAGALLYRSVELSEKNVELSERSIELGEKNIKLGEKSIKLGGENIAIGRHMLEKQDTMIEEVRGVRYDLKSYMESRFEKIDSEMADIKLALRQRGII
ncbi:MAG: acylphosphatase [Euryarchaeota archaeon]|nr:acylphosphatase [Euryarchaeota archaeon]